jgi:hypothetical protein
MFGGFDSYFLHALNAWFFVATAPLRCNRFGWVSRLVHLHTAAAASGTLAKCVLFSA